MSYRDDHDAALARADALEAENRRLREQLAAKPKPPEPPETPEPRRDADSSWHKWLGAVLALTIAGIFGAVFIFFRLRDSSVSRPIEQAPSELTTGELVVSESVLGSWKHSLGLCASGQHKSFNGVELGDKVTMRNVLRVVEDPIKGTTVLLQAPNAERALVLPREHCPEMRVDIRPTDTMINFVREVGGDIDLDCALPDGGRARVKAHFERCY